MALNKLRQLDQNSLGVTLPKDDLRIDGLLNESGELRGEHYVHIRHIEEGEWKIELLDERYS
ncbi:uncharacterized protein Nmag_0290 [Natrialba magadii ATCC 43099]|uniref:DUF8053 domain-containing protein n=1 Tax=Natrialba magadii (strain ATCC 43099 / DSM 3394 / CCM 3739 / CIP 104546 / IAM 13178 / JCM 8861 / NBRC 102185 / NCIMB 2190 / MS3) TaxID=547559 RepID=D3SX62_NATMM|nr:hypothetical protein [Natrialba magadii]ADD03882.1 uncharacterized protein Nmag_0290 [Natrialba magadii ATCC 43099]